MHRFASEFVGKKVLLRQEGMIAGDIGEVIINPENGEFLGFVVVVPTKKKLRKALPEKEILGINREFILVRGVDSLGDLDEVVRIKKARDQAISIERNKVFTVSNIYLGRVSDYTIDLVSGKISRLYVQPTSLMKITGSHIIEAKRIVSIKKNRITIDDATVKTKQKKAIKGVPAKSECN